MSGVQKWTSNHKNLLWFIVNWPQADIIPPLVNYSSEKAELTEMCWFVAYKIIQTQVQILLTLSFSRQWDQEDNTGLCLFLILEGLPLFLPPPPHLFFQLSWNYMIMKTLQPYLHHHWKFPLWGATAFWDLTSTNLTGYLHSKYHLSAI